MTPVLRFLYATYYAENLTNTAYLSAEEFSEGLLFLRFTHKDTETHACKQLAQSFKTAYWQT